MISLNGPGVVVLKTDRQTDKRSHKQALLRTIPSTPRYAGCAGGKEWILVNIQHVSRLIRVYCVMLATVLTGTVVDV